MLGQILCFKQTESVRHTDGHTVGRTYSRRITPITMATPSMSDHGTSNGS